MNRADLEDHRDRALCAMWEAEDRGDLARAHRLRQRVERTEQHRHEQQREGAPMNDAVDLSKPGGMTDYARQVADMMHQRDHPDRAACNLYEWLLAGDAIESRGCELPDDVPSMRAGQCFENAMGLALDRRDLTYVEGVGSGFGAIHHGWCIDTHGRVVDPTWHGHEPPPAERFYLGVAIPDDLVRQWILATGFWGLLGGNLRAAAILLRHGSIEPALDEIATICLGCGHGQCRCEICDGCEEKIYRCDCCVTCGASPDGICDCDDDEEIA